MSYPEKRRPDLESERGRSHTKTKRGGFILMMVSKGEENQEGGRAIDQRLRGKPHLTQRSVLRKEGQKRDIGSPGVERK